MPNVRRAHAKFQFTEYNYWEHIFSLLPEKDQELKKEVSDMIMNTVFFTQNTQPVPDGEFIVKNREGKKVKLSGDDLIEGTKETPKYIPVDDPEYARFFKDKLDLLDRIEKKYSGKNHEALKQEIGILRCKNQNLAKGVGYEFAPGDYIIIGTNGLQKFQDLFAAQGHGSGGQAHRRSAASRQAHRLQGGARQTGSLHPLFRELH